jgi:DNA modification methylase
MEYNKIYVGDVLDELKKMPDQCIQTVVTSPPYLNQRDYGVGGQIGLEKTPQEYVDKMVKIFSEVRRVLRDDGTVWLNLGSSYAGSGKGQYASGCHDPKRPKIDGMKLDARTPTGYKAKNLIPIPWMVAMALQSDGWILRQDIIWNKTNAQPEPVKDRCVMSHEYIFLLSKSPKYYFDYEAIKEPAAMNRWGGKKPMNTQNSKDKEGVFKGLTRERDMMPEMRNKRSVWSVPTRPFAGAHMAVFPPALIEPCVLAGAPVGGVVMDIFIGSGTTALVAKKLGRQWIGIEIKQEYADMAQKRIDAI